MLVLSRKNGQKVVIQLPDKRLVSVLVNRINGNAVSLAVDAPADIKVLRGELLGRGAA